MTGAIRCPAVLVLLTLAGGRLDAEVPPLSPDDLKKNAALIVTGTVSEVKVVDKKPRSDDADREEEYRLTVRVGKVEKGKLKEGVKTVVARGFYRQLKRGFVGSAGHYSDNTDDRIAAVGKGWELTLYLRPAADGTFEILFPNGFAVQKKPAAE